MHKAIYLLAGLTIFATTQSLADDQYVELDAGAVTMSNADLMPNTSSLRLAYGAKKNSIVGFVKGEVDVISFGDSSYSSASSSVSISRYAVRAAYILGFPVSNDFSITGKLGVTMNHVGASGINTNADANSFDVIYGAGVAYEASRKITFNAGWESMGQFKAVSFAPGSSLNQISAGIAYNF